VGEVRDPETIRMTLTAALTGHLVLSTIHSGSAVMAIDRMIDAFPEGEKHNVRQDLATCLRHVVAQQLVASKSGERVPAVETLTVNHAIAAQIRDGPYARGGNAPRSRRRGRYGPHEPRARKPGSLRPSRPHRRTRGERPSRCTREAAR
jgi:type II secretory ATPase GspE/PulE/Tfp pilus assembly ATPase PilB-like protein